MKKTIQIFSMLLIALTVMVSCKKDTDPEDRDFFVGTYSGTITYNDGSKDISDDDGKVRVVKAGDTYNFIFGTGIPDITGVKFQGSGDTYTSIGDGLTGIRVNASTLKILVSKDGKRWTADCTR